MSSCKLVLAVVALLGVGASVKSELALIDCSLPAGMKVRLVCVCVCVCVKVCVVCVKVCGQCVCVCV